MKQENEENDIQMELRTKRILKMIVAGTKEGTDKLFEHLENRWYET